MTTPQEGGDSKRIEYLGKVQECKDAHPVGSAERQACILAVQEEYYPNPAQ